MAKKKQLMICESQVAAVFSAPAYTSNRVGQLWRGQEVVVLARDGTWAKIDTPAGWVGGVHLRLPPEISE